MSEKACFKCHEVKPLSEYYRHPVMADGHIGKCKACTKRDVNANRHKRIDYYRAYDRERFQSDPKRRADAKATTKRIRKAHPYKSNAHTRVARAIRKGVLVRKPCEVCAHPCTHAHHDDYSKPLDVKWLCPVHHAARHQELLRAKQ